MDCFKGILMLGVILGHAVTAFKAGTSISVDLHIFVRTYDMPFFILISGMFLAKSVDKYVPWKNILNKISSIMVPILVWNGIFYMIKCMISLLLGNKIFSLGGLISAFLGSWFLWSALACSCIMIVICGVFKKTYWRLIASVAVSVVCLFIPNDMWNIAFMFPFYAVGFFTEWATSKIDKKSLDILRAVSVAAFVVLWCFWSSKYTVWNSGSYLLGGNAAYTFKAVLIRFFIGATGCVTMALVFDVLMRCENPVMKFINRQIVSVGKNTMIIYIFQGFIIEFLFAEFIELFVEKLGFNPFVFNSAFLGYVIAPVTAFVCMIILDRIIIAMKKIPLIGKYIFGFKAIDAKKK